MCDVLLISSDMLHSVRALLDKVPSDDPMDKGDDVDERSSRDESRDVSNSEKHKPAPMSSPRIVVSGPPVRRRKSQKPDSNVGVKPEIQAVVSKQRVQPLISKKRSYKVMRPIKLSSSADEQQEGSNEIKRDVKVGPLAANENHHRHLSAVAAPANTPLTTRPDQTSEESREIKPHKEDVNCVPFIPSMGFDLLADMRSTNSEGPQPPFLLVWIERVSLHLTCVHVCRVLGRTRGRRWRDICGPTGG